MHAQKQPGAYVISKGNNCFVFINAPPQAPEGESWEECSVQ